METVAETKKVTLSQSELRRYQRHLTLPEVGVEGQKKLKQASVLLIGAGGLGSPLALYLAAAGVGRIGIVDFDTVDESNLQRQVLHGTADVGRPKLESARDRLTDINPYVKLDLHETRLSSENALELVRDFDVVADGTDNFPTRYLVNDASILTGTPNAYASIYQFEGQASVFGAEAGPCYRCLYPEPPPPGLVPSCAEGGVLGVLPGIMGTLQATEVMKLLLGIGDPLIGRLLLFDALEMSFRTLTVPRNPDCPICGDHPKITELIDYEEFCGIPSPDDIRDRHDSVPEVSVQYLKTLRDADAAPFILDVRKPFEDEIASLGADQLIPHDELEFRISELRVDRDADIVVHCRSGVRSAKAVHVLNAAGFERAVNLAGGILAWSREIDSTVPEY